MRRPLLILLAALGAALAVLTIVRIALAPDRAALALLAGTELAAGRETALTTALAAGVPWLRAATITTAIEWSMLLLGAPLLILGGDWLRERTFVRSKIRKAEMFARTNPRAGVLALAALTIAPFVPVGALTSVLVGEVLRIRQALLVPALLAADLLANVGVAWAASETLGLFPHPRIVAGVTAGALLAVAMTAALWPRAPPESEFATTR